jgi:hypothetical protein
MEFVEFRRLFEKHVKSLTEGEEYLFVTGINPDMIWETYLESFPPGTNEIFRERREFDCSCCRSFIRQFGNVVAIKDNKITTIWDFETGDDKYQVVINALSVLIKSKFVSNVFLSDTRSFGTNRNSEQLEDGRIHTWYHLFTRISDSVKTFRRDAIGTVRGDFRATRDVMLRSFEELTSESIETVLELISQKSLYKGEEWQKPLKLFWNMYKTYHRLETDEEKNNFCWKKSLEVGAALGRIKNHSIGVLLSDISGGMDLDDAVRRYENIVAPSNYKRPKAIFTKKMIEQARIKVAELGFEGSLGRRFAKLDDITVNNILFANRDTARRMAGDVFEELAGMVPDKPKSFDRVEEVGIETFVKEILPNAKEIELLVENHHEPNMMSLIAPKNLDSKSMFKWNNGFSWAYAGSVTDSMKERVKAAGGRVDGVLRFSIQWNDNNDTLDDFDAHCKEAGGFYIYYGNKRNHTTGGNLDVDIINPNGVAVENITWPNKRKMKDGKYEFSVHNYTRRGGKSGFTAEVEFDGKMYSFSYAKPLRQNEVIPVADVTLKNGEFSIKERIPSTMASREIWGLTSNKFHSVSACMYSPNYWDDQNGIGHRHYFFLLKNCKNEENPNGFFNEFLNEELMKHKRVFEALGSKMSVEDSENQLSGLGFSATKRASVVCRVHGSFTRVIKLVF